MLPHIKTTLVNEKARGAVVIDRYRLPDGSMLFRLSDFTIIKAAADGSSEGRLSTSSWQDAKKGLVG